MEANTLAGGVVALEGNPEGGATIRDGGENFNPGVPNNIGGSSPRTTTPYDAAATEFNEGVSFTH